MIKLTPALLLLLFATPAPALADGDAAKGEKVFGKCKACHDVASDKNKVGPTLQGVIGRKAGTVPGFKYSEAMMASGVWAGAFTKEWAYARTDREDRKSVV